MQDLTIIIKPVSFLCNIDCSYCYHDWLRDDNSKIVKKMTEKTVMMIFNKLAILPQKRIRIIWHGGEPLLAGIDFFEKALLAQEKYPGKFINLIQTNGTLIIPSMADIFKKGKFNVGVSIDGPKLINDSFRKRSDGKGTFDDIMKGIKTLQMAGVEVGVVSVVTNQSADEAKKIFDFFYDNNLFKMNFSPCTDAGKYSISNASWAKFLWEIFNLWLEKDDTRVKIVPIESFVQGLVGGRPTVCYYKKDCSNFLSIDYDGTVYACGRTLGNKDFRIGNILHQDFQDMLGGDDFCRIRKNTITPSNKCINCKWQSICNGGCPLQRTGDNMHYCFCETMKILLPKMNKVIQQSIS